MKNNFVHKYMHLTSKPSVIVHKKTSLKSEANLRDAREDALNELIGPKTITFEGGSTVCWDESEDSLQGCLDCVGCSSIEINCEEDYR